MEEITEIVLLNYESSFRNESAPFGSHILLKCDDKRSSFLNSSLLIDFPLNYVC